MTFFVFYNPGDPVTMRKVASDFAAKRFPLSRQQCYEK